MHEATNCTTTTNRTCAAVDADHYSAAGDNGQHACFNVQCVEGAWRNGLGCNARTGEGYKCVAW